MNALNFVLDRLKEPSSWASLAAWLLIVHVSVDPGLWSQITLWGTAVAAALGVVLKERGTVPTPTLVADGLSALASAAKTGAVAAVLGMLLLAPLAACSTPAPSPKVAVVATESGLAVAGHAALVYLTLPVCTGTNGPLCSTAAIKASVKSAFDQAYAAVTYAQTAADGGATPDLTAATAALTALQDIVADLPKAGS